MTIKMLQFELEGKPKPYVRMTQRGKYVRKEAQEYLASKARMASQMVEQMRGKEPFGRYPLGSTIVFSYERGADHRRDLDNEVKAVLDAANGIVYADDCWIDHIEAFRGNDDEGVDRVYLTVWEEAL